MFWTVWTLSPWDISPTGFPKGNLSYYLPYLVSILKTSICTIPQVPRVTQLDYPRKLTTSYQQILPLFVGAALFSNNLQLPLYFASPYEQEQKLPKWRISGPITTSVGPLCLSEPLLPFGFWNLQCHSQHHMTASWLLTKVTNTFWWQLLCCKIIWYTPLEQSFYCRLIFA